MLSSPNVDVYESQHDRRLYDVVMHGGLVLSEASRAQVEAWSRRNARFHLRWPEDRRALQNLEQAAAGDL